MKNSASDRSKSSLAFFKYAWEAANSWVVLTLASSSTFLALSSASLVVFWACSFACSTIFLASYLTYHARVGSVRFPGVGGARALYLGILLTHTILAAAVAPIAVVTLSFAWRGRFEKHRRLARWTLPIWLYVSVTGVIIYVMLYQMRW